MLVRNHNYLVDNTFFIPADSEKEARTAFAEFIRIYADIYGIKGKYNDEVEILDTGTSALARVHPLDRLITLAEALDLGVTIYPKQNRADLLFDTDPSCDCVTMDRLSLETSTVEIPSLYKTNDLFSLETKEIEIVCYVHRTETFQKKQHTSDESFRLVPAFNDMGYVDLTYFLSFKK